MHASFLLLDMTKQVCARNSSLHLEDSLYSLYGMACYVATRMFV